MKKKENKEERAASVIHADDSEERETGLYLINFKQP
jgi:hypothetical protein